MKMVITLRGHWKWLILIMKMEILWDVLESKRASFNEWSNDEEEEEKKSDRFHLNFSLN